MSRTDSPANWDPHGERDRLLELLADQTLFGLEASERTELQRLLGDDPEIDDDCMERIAADCAVAFLPPQEEWSDLPLSVRARVIEALPDTAPEPIVIAGPAPGGSGWQAFAAWSGWVAAACLLLAWSFSGGPSVEDVQSPAQQRAQLVAAAQDVIDLAWSATEDPAAAGASGDIAWSNERQAGFMRFRGLAANDPQLQQYQLWIFDAQQEHPIDGGVFDVPAGASEVVVPVQAKLRVQEPTMFAITIEKPGGVVVSQKERIPLLAQIAES